MKLSIGAIPAMLFATPALIAPAIAQTDSSALRDAVTLAAIRAHQAALADIATANGGTRDANTPGYQASVEYVAEKLGEAGYQVTVQPFHFQTFEETSPPEMSRTAPEPLSYAQGTDFLTVRYSGSGTVEGAVVPTTDVVIPPAPEPSSTSGCEPEDFPAAPNEAAIVLVQRGTCPYQQKVDNAAAAGYAAVLIFNEGQDGRQEVVQGTLNGPVTIPALTTTFAVGEELFGLAQAGEVRVRAAVDAETVAAQTSNVIGEAQRGSAESVVIVGAHLDSVAAGPGINDNGSGTAAILEIAIQLARLGITPPNRLRFAFWGAEEWGLLGSTHYVEQLTSEELGRIVLNLNYDMLGSPNPVSFVYDGDGSTTGPAGPPGSGEIEAVFTQYFQANGLPTRPSAFDGRSDYGPFIAQGIPAGGLFSGAEALKTADEAQDFGGTAGEAYDKCYHQACDDLANVNEPALDVLSDAAAHAVLHFATELPAPVVTAFRAGAGRAASAVPMDSLPFRGEAQFQN
jgi:Zn-dependent M28 family amino/carboxypeptidase